MQAASKALKEREAALLTLHAIEADLEKRRQAVAIVEGESQKVLHCRSAQLCFCGLFTPMMLWCASMVTSLTAPTDAIQTKLLPCFFVVS